MRFHRGCFTKSRYGIGPIAIAVAMASAQYVAADTYYGPKDNSIVPPSPDVATLMQYQEIPVDYFSGVPNISYDLFTVKAGGISIPIRLSYHGGGMRVTEKAGDVGVCWSISSGAVIARTVYGAPDEANTNAGLNGLLNLTSEEREFRRRLMTKGADYNPTDGDLFAEKRAWEVEFGNKYRNNLLDLANDQFRLSGLGLSASFAYDDNKRIIMSSPTPIKFIDAQPVSVSYPSEFVVKNAFGIEYIFGVNEKTRYEYYYGAPELTRTLDSLLYTSAWHLSEVSDPCGNEVRFVYSDKTPIKWRESGSDTWNYSLNREFAHAIVSDSRSCGTIVYYPKRLEHIEWNGGKVVYEYAGTDNESFSGTPILKCIKVYNNTDILPVKTFRFEYNIYSNEYYDSAHSSQPKTYTLLSAVYDNDKPIYRFEYNTDENGGISAYYDSQDFAGYHNGKDNEGGLAGRDKAYNNSGADRSVSPADAVIGALKTIRYPTGGRTEIKWESNIVGYLDNLQLPCRVNDTHITQTETDTLRMCLDASYKKLSLSNVFVPSHTEVTLDIGRYFLMNPANLYLTDYYNQHDSDIEHYADLNPFNYPHITVRRHSDGKLMQVIFIDSATIEPSNGLVRLDIGSGYYDFTLVNPMSVSGAEDFLEREFMHGDAIAGRIYIIKETTDNASMSGGRDYWAGIRVKSISSYTSDQDQAPIIKKYGYGDKDPGITSGTVQMLPRYDNNYYMAFTHPTLLGSGYTEVFSYGSAAFPNTPVSTLWQIQYPKVMTFLSREDPNYPDDYLHQCAHIYRFTSSQDYDNSDYNRTAFLGFQPVGARMYTSVAHRRGLLTSHQDGIGGTPPITSYEYNIYEADNPSILTTEPFVLCDYSHNPVANGGYGGCDYGIGTYSIIPYNKTVRRENYQEGYDNKYSSGYNSSKDYEYFYNGYTTNLDYNLVKTMTTKDSEGRSIVTHYTYFNAEGLYTPLVETTVTECGGSVISATRNTYDTNTRLLKATYTIGQSASSASLLSTSGKGTTNMQKSLINKVLYEYIYDNRGNITQINYSGTPLVAYIWGYSGSYPIIEAKGISCEQLCAAAISAGVPSERILTGNVADQETIANMAQAVRNVFPSKDVCSLCYRPLIGIIEKIGADGVRNIYNYDNRGRLSEIRDFNSFLIEKYRYEYATEPAK